MIGKIVKAISGFYYIEVCGKVYECRAKWILKKNNISPMVGDNAEFEEIGQDVGNLISVVDRKNSLIRPPVANVDKVIIVVAAKNPEPSLLFIDKQLVFLEKMKIPATICLNKVDIDKAEEIKNIYEKIGYDVILTSVKEKIGIEELREIIKGKTVAFVGNSGVGKSSLTNQLMNEVIMQEGDLSKIERGKQTTRIVKLYKFENGYLADTAGFSMLDLSMVSDLKKEEISSYYPDFLQGRRECKYRSCLHTHGDCGVIKKVQDGEVSKLRYDNYLKILAELDKNKKF